MHAAKIGRIPHTTKPQDDSAIPHIPQIPHAWNSRPDCAFLLSEEGQQAIVSLHIDGITACLGIH